VLLLPLLQLGSQLSAPLLRLSSMGAGLQQTGLPLPHPRSLFRGLLLHCRELLAQGPAFCLGLHRLVLLSGDVWYKREYFLASEGCKTSSFRSSPVQMLAAFVDAWCPM